MLHQHGEEGGHHVLHQHEEEGGHHVLHQHGEEGDAVTISLHCLSIGFWTLKSATIAKHLDRLVYSHV